MLVDAKRSAENDKKRFHRDYRTAEELVQAREVGVPAPRTERTTGVGSAPEPRQGTCGNL